ncbi:MAG: hypothetical protein LBC83_07710 [Oscillospiraceae bacterium]|jgi:hypothetical protein|nr:hypothetical protein [Oscillospiraceae bacterium]
MNYSAVGLGSWLHLRKEPPLALEDAMAERYSFLEWERAGQAPPGGETETPSAMQRLLTELMENTLTPDERAALLAAQESEGARPSRQALSAATGLPATTAARRLETARVKLRPLVRAALRYQTLLREEQQRFGTETRN